MNITCVAIVAEIKKKSDRDQTSF